MPPFLIDRFLIDRFLIDQFLTGLLDPPARANTQPALLSLLAGLSFFPLAPCATFPTQGATKIWYTSRGELRLMPP